MSKLTIALHILRVIAYAVVFHHTECGIKSTMAVMLALIVVSVASYLLGLK